MPKTHPFQDLPETERPLIGREVEIIVGGDSVDTTQPSGHCDVPEDGGTSYGPCSKRTDLEDHVDQDPTTWFFGFLSDTTIVVHDGGEH